MPSSGARSGTTPSRSDRGAGDGKIAVACPTLVCGHEADSRTPVAVFPGNREMYRCSRGCGLEKRKPR